VSGLYVWVRAADEQYALPVADVLEVAELGDVTPVPGADAAVVGVRNLRGQVLPVVDLQTVLGLPRAQAPERIVIVEREGRVAGLAVEMVADVERLPDASEEPESPHLSGASLVDGALVGVVDVGAVLDAVEEAHTS
jgi:purine-binding chemotaxis protein CheW